MTGFAASAREGQAGSVSVEIRSVNARFLDLSFRAPDDLRAAELAIRDLISASVQRGKVECRISFRSADTRGASQALQLEALERLVVLSDQVRARIPDAAAPTVAEVLRWPGVLAEDDSAQALVTLAIDAGREALDAFLAHRGREGQRLVAVILERADAIAEIVRPIRDRGPELVAAHEKRLAERLQTAVDSLGARVPVEDTMARVRQELALYGMRADVTEELDRLLAHLDELRGACKGGGPVGKRLDFLLQELNREANTLGSKAAVIDLSRAAVELKLLIEQIREQVQNLE
jgi:uncharacterized protein (TIGR00255 family)